MTKAMISETKSIFEKIHLVWLDMKTTSDLDVFTVCPTKTGA